MFALCTNRYGIRSNKGSRTSLPTVTSEYSTVNFKELCYRDVRLKSGRRT